MHTVHESSVMPGVNLTCIKTDKFKTGCLSIYLISSLDRETASTSALLPRVLRRGSAKYPDMERISSALDDLYGANIEPIVRKKGELHCIGLHVDFIDDRFISSGEGIFEQAVSLAGDILLSPALVNSSFNSEYVESEKKNLIDDICAAINDKRGYSVDRLLEEMCAREAYGVSRLGSKETACEITAESLTTHYKNLLSASCIDIYYCGPAEPDLVRSALYSIFQNIPGQGRKEAPSTDIVLYPPENAPQRVTESLDVSQGKLVAGFRMGKTMKNEPDYPAMMVFNSVYGGSVTSKLFVNVRERLALCYYASSMIDKHKGIMVVSSGVEFSNFEIALEEINAQLGHVKSGNVSDNELLSAKQAIMTSVKSAMDRPSGLLELYFDSSVSSARYDPNELCEMVDKVTLDRVVDIASEINLDTIYFLTN